MGKIYKTIMYESLLTKKQITNTQKTNKQTNKTNLKLFSIRGKIILSL